jgi:ABC-2 type transport system permease protein
VNAVWSVRRELWESRYVYIVPLIVAALYLVGFVIGAAHLPLSPAVRSSASPAARLLESPLDSVSLALMLAYVVIAVIYCLGALHHERFDRSILFWKSLPVSDLTTVLAKASVPTVILPLLTFALTVGTQTIMLLAGSAVLLARGDGAAALWAQTPLLPMWAATLYHLVSMHALYWAPFYGWLLLVSGWARRAAFLWATLPVAAILVIESLIFHTSVIARMLLSQLAGGRAALRYPPPAGMPMRAPTLHDMGALLASPGLWIGLAVFAIFLVAAARLRRQQGPI